MTVAATYRQSPSPVTQTQTTHVSHGSPRPCESKNTPQCLKNGRLTNESPNVTQLACATE